VNNTLDTEESDEHPLYLRFRHASSLGLWGLWLFPLKILIFAFGNKVKVPGLISSDNF
jgi:hypothetical protein